MCEQAALNTSDDGFYRPSRRCVARALSVSVGLCYRGYQAEYLNIALFLLSKLPVSAKLVKSLNFIHKTS